MAMTSTEEKTLILGLHNIIIARGPLTARQRFRLQEATIAMAVLEYDGCCLGEFTYTGTPT
jgi:hypothetical protein